jgi:hypothetical protein
VEESRCVEEPPSVQVAHEPTDSHAESATRSHGRHRVGFLFFFGFSYFFPNLLSIFSLLVLALELDSDLVSVLV